MSDQTAEPLLSIEKHPWLDRWAQFWNRTRIYLQIFIVFLVLLLVYHEIKKLNIHMVQQALEKSDPVSIALGFFLAFLALCVMGLYDALAFPAGDEGRLTFKKRWGMGSLLFAWTNFVSIGPIGGPALRLLVYRRFGLKGSQITNSLIAHYIGMNGGMAGWMLAVWVALPGKADCFAVRIALAAVGSVVFTHVAGRIAAGGLNRFLHRHLAVPVPLSGLGIVSFFDWGLMLAAFWQFIHAVGVDIPAAAAARTLFTGQLAGVISMVPGGLGSADAIWLKGFDLLGVMPGAAAAAIVVFRSGFYFIPWLAALSVMYGVTLAHSNPLRIWQRRIVAGAVLVNAGLLLLGAALPEIPPRLAVLEKMAPLGIVEASHLLATVSAALMMFLVRGLWRGYRTAYVLSMALFAASALAHPLKGSNYGEAVIALVLMAMLFGARKAFTRRGRVPLAWEPALAVGVAVLAIYLVAGLTAFDRISFGNDVWTTFAFHAQSHRFLRAAALLCVVAIVVVIRQALLPVSEWITPDPADIDRAEAFCRLHAESADALQIGGGDKAVWFWEPQAPEISGVVLYQCFADKLVVHKYPVLTSQSDPARLLDDFMAFARDQDMGVIFSMVTGPWMEHLHDFGYHFIKVTEEAIVPLTDFSLEGGKNAGFRRTLRDMQKAGISFEFMAPPFPGGTMDQLRTVSDAWLRSKGGQEMQFSPCYFSPEYILRNPVAVARETSGRIIAFVNVLSTRTGGPAALDFMRYIPGTANNVMDFVIVNTMQELARRKIVSFSLGGAPMSDVGARPQARVTERAMHLISKRAENRFNFQGLLQYKNKFHPQWKPRYLAYPKPWDWASALAVNLRLVQAGERDARRRIAAARMGGTS
ncbi:phosphatidylglycerol lysyltransferase domain-containing protein [Desulfobacter vibrioformis]|uniref:phosphatidylglycerol lysyltransferase domain-containing protein n=1 Tax=Desulfobacter vibrioformis TaxID=34031 RepID=UPI000555E8D1|nr:phosphatidylglycerol lysyltransferase domain-containing protein [Desulfobacter vibrioformis]